MSKVEVIIDACTYIVIVFNKLLLSDSLVGCLAIEKVVVGLKSLQKLTKNLLGCLPSFDHCGMLLRVVYFNYIFDLNFPIAVLIKLLEGFEDKTQPVLVHFSSDGSDELFVIDFAIAIEIIGSEKGAHILRAHICHEVAASLFKLSPRQRTRVVVVHDPEKSCKTDDALRATLGDFLAESIEKLTDPKSVRQRYLLLAVRRVDG